MISKPGGKTAGLFRAPNAPFPGWAVGVGVGHYNYHHHYYGHRRWHSDHYRYW